MKMNLFIYNTYIYICVCVWLSLYIYEYFLYTYFYDYDELVYAAYFLKYVFLIYA